MEAEQLDGRLIQTKAQLHSTLKLVLGLDDHYGGNLDALYDVLTTKRETLTITHGRQLSEHLGSYATSVQRVLSDAAVANPDFHYEWREGR
ncbi:MAG: barstar family protein [Aerococcus sp.]|nr:barstar family protein [Aerococcus sp.]